MQNISKDSLKIISLHKSAICIIKIILTNFLLFYHFIGQAAPANFKSDAFGTLDTEFHMEWVTESITPITTFKLQYKSDTYYNEVEDDESSWKEVHVAPQVNGDHFFSGRHTLTNLSSASRYVARVASKNNYGYSKYSQPFRFATKGAGKLIHLI